MWNQLLHYLGIEPRSPSTAYNFWSGFGSDLSEIAIVGGLISIYRGHNCHVKGCWRIGKHQVGPYKVCSIHHPAVNGTITQEHINEAHRGSQGP